MRFPACYMTYHGTGTVGLATMQLKAGQKVRIPGAEFTALDFKRLGYWVTITNLDGAVLHRAGCLDDQIKKEAEPEFVAANIIAEPAPKEKIVVKDEEPASVETVTVAEKIVSTQKTVEEKVDESVVENELPVFTFSMEKQAQPSTLPGKKKKRK